jgi:DNA-binding transcriptional MerR regulator
MRMQDLSRATGLPVPTVKYYLREGLLAPGERVAPNQARYGAAHVRRLRQVRALLEVCGLSVAEVRELLDQGHIQPRRSQSPPLSEEDTRWAVNTVSAIARTSHWTVADNAPAVAALVRVLCAVREFCPDTVLDRLEDYASLADATADIDLATDHNEMSMILADALFAALHRLARNSRHSSLQTR